MTDPPQPHGIDPRVITPFLFFINITFLDSIRNKCNRKDIHAFEKCKDPGGGGVSDLFIPAGTCFRVFKLTKILPQSPTHKSQDVLIKWWVHRESFELSIGK